MKVLIISPGFHPVTGGHGGAIENLINIYLQKNDSIYRNEVVVYSAKKGNSFDKQIYKYTKFRIIDVKSLKYRVKHLIKNFIRVIKQEQKQRYYIDEIIKDLKKNKEENYYDKIIFENGDEFILSFKKKINTNSRIVLHLHNDHININNKDSINIIDAVDEIWAVSNFIKNRIDNVKQTGKVRVLYNTIDYSLFKKKLLPTEKSELKKQYNISKNDFVFIYVGRIMEEKGVLELVNAFNSLNKTIKNIKLLIVGGSISLKNKSEYLDKVKNISSNNKNIIFTGQIKNYELYKYYQISDCQVIPSKWLEAFGLIALEGIASNLKIISSTSGGLPEVLENSCEYVETDNLTKNLEEKMMLVLKKSTTNNNHEYKRIMSKFSLRNYTDTFNKYLEI